MFECVVFQMLNKHLASRATHSKQASVRHLVENVGFKRPFFCFVLFFLLRKELYGDDDDDGEEKDEEEDSIFNARSAAKVILA